MTARTPPRGCSTSPLRRGIVAAGADAILLGGGPMLFANREQIVALAGRHALPMI
jgi:hypothetical protein